MSKNKHNNQKKTDKPPSQATPTENGPKTLGAHSTQDIKDLILVEARALLHQKKTSIADLIKWTKALEDLEKEQ